GAIRQLRVVQRQSACHDIGKRRRAGKVMQEMPVDVQQHPSAAEVSDDVRIPQLVEEGPGGHGN
ncbi:hypothetical protein, partial [Metabacillus litoralis]|uniref:hypothetical protein n=1 Tax=Metabacillus litoralis TaxID=152268 RepID=UPI0020424A66